MAETTQTQNPVPHFDLPHELEQVLKVWAARQSPHTDFTGWRMCAFAAPVRLKNGLFFNPGELTLCRRAEEKAAEFADKLGLPPPLAVWSFARAEEVLINPALVTLETEPFDELQLDPAEVDDLDIEESTDSAAA